MQCSGKLILERSFSGSTGARLVQDIDLGTQTNSYQPEIPSAKEILTNGISLPEMNMLLFKNDIH
jgi:hypothetical protein